MLWFMPCVIKKRTKLSGNNYTQYNFMPKILQKIIITKKENAQIFRGDLVISKGSFQ